MNKTILLSIENNNITYGHKTFWFFLSFYSFFYVGMHIKFTCLEQRKAPDLIFYFRVHIKKALKILFSYLSDFLLLLVPA